MWHTDLLRMRHHWLRSYGIAVLSSVLALLLTLLLDDPSTEPNILLVFLAAVVFSSWYGGLGPGLLATFLTTLSATYFSMTPNNLSAAVRLIEYVAVAMLVSWLNAARPSDR